MGHNTARFLWTINLYLSLDPYLKSNWKANFEASKSVQTTRNWKLCWSSVCDWQLLTAVASLINQIIWTILAMIVIGLFSVLYQRTVHGWRHFYLLGKQNLVWKSSRMRGEIIGFFIIKQIKKPPLCSVVKHLGSGRALKKWGKTLDFVSCFPLHFFRALLLLACFTTEQSTVEASLFVKLIQCTENLNFSNREVKP